jgi:hypothetical protein
MILILRLRSLFPDDPEVNQLFRATFGYPEDLPNLPAKRPRSNSRPDGVRMCHFLRKREGNLPEVY